MRVKVKEFGSLVELVSWLEIVQDSVVVLNTEQGSVYRLTYHEIPVAERPSMGLEGDDPSASQD